MAITAFIQQVFGQRLKTASVLAVYDPDRLYRDVCLTMADADTTVVDASDSSIEARESAMLALATLTNPMTSWPPCVRQVAARIGLRPRGLGLGKLARYGQAYKDRI